MNYCHDKLTLFLCKFVTILTPSFTSWDMVFPVASLNFLRFSISNSVILTSNLQILFSFFFGLPLTNINPFYKRKIKGAVVNHPSRFEPQDLLFVSILGCRDSSVLFGNPVVVLIPDPESFDSLLDRVKRRSFRFNFLPEFVCLVHVASLLSNT